MLWGSSLRGAWSALPTPEARRDANEPEHAQQSQNNYTERMYLSPRHHQLITLISKFGFLNSKQLQYLLFNDSRSNNPSYKAFDDLTEANYITRLNVGLRSKRGGNTTLVFKLGPTGQRLFSHRATPRLDELNHTLSVGDLYVALVKLEREGRLVLRNWQTEPDAHRVVKSGNSQYYLKPDFYAEISRPASDHVLPMMFEVDQSTQSQRQITEKLARYWNARQTQTPDSTPAHPRYFVPDDLLVVFIAIHEQRASELRDLLAKDKEEQRKIFRVHTLDSFVAQF